MREGVKFFPIQADRLFKYKNYSKEILDHISGEIFLSKIKIFGFKEHSWECSPAPHATTKSGLCVHKVNETGGIERYYGVFKTHLTSFLAKLKVTVDGQPKECDLLSVALGKSICKSVANATVAGNRDQPDDSKVFHLLFDFSFNSSNPMGLEIHQWKVVGDWNADTTTSDPETMKQDSTHPPPDSRYSSPLFHVYVDHQCLGISYSQAMYFNRRLSQYLDLNIAALVASAMKSHFLIHAGRPYSLHKLNNSSLAAIELRNLFDSVGQWLGGGFTTIIPAITGTDVAGPLLKDALNWAGSEEGKGTIEVLKTIGRIMGSILI